MRDGDWVVRVLWRVHRGGCKHLLAGVRGNVGVRMSPADTLRRMAAPVDLAAALATFAEPWSPRTVAVMNDYDIRVVRTHGEFTWHSHPDTDEFFLVLQGCLTIRLEDDDEVVLGPGQMYIVPKGKKHQPFSAEGRKSC